MAGSQVSKTVSAVWFEAMSHGYQAVSITNENNTALPAVETGSRIEISGEGYQFTATTISGWGGISNSTQAYIKFVPAGTVCTVEFTDTGPTWNSTKQGWYDGNDRYLYTLYKDGAGLYTLKAKIHGEEYNTIDAIQNINSIANIQAIGDVGDITSIGDVGEIGVVGRAAISRIEPAGNFHNGATTAGTVYTALSPYLPNISDELLITGGIGISGGASNVITAIAVRTSGSAITIYGYSTSTGDATIVLNSGAATLTACSIAW